VSEKTDDMYGSRMQFRPELFLDGSVSPTNVASGTKSDLLRYVDATDLQNLLHRQTHTDPEAMCNDDGEPMKKGRFRTTPISSSDGPIYHTVTSAQGGDTKTLDRFANKEDRW
jgi:hypothetical protein